MEEGDCAHTSALEARFSFRKAPQVQIANRAASEAAELQVNVLRTGDLKQAVRQRHELDRSQAFTNGAASLGSGVSHAAMMEAAPPCAQSMLFIQAMVKFDG